VSAWDGVEDELGGGVTRTVLALLVATVAVFLVQRAADAATADGFTLLFGLVPSQVARGHVWQLATYLFLHGGVLHLLLNMLGLFLLGPSLERAVGSRQFLSIYLLSGLLGGLGWLLISFGTRAVCVGASGAVFGVLGAFAALFPHRRITLLVFYVIPVTMKAWVLVTVLAVIQLIFVTSPASGGIAHAAHLAGGLAGWAYTMAVFRRGTVRETWEEAARRRDSARQARRSREDEETRREVDRILDKIASQGIHTLTPRERSLLEKASTRTPHT
jgi:membrane associated rhomboid family serine protease